MSNDASSVQSLLHALRHGDRAGGVGKAKAAAKPAGTKKRRGVKLEPTQLTAPEIAITEPSSELTALAKQVESDGGAVLASYREPLGGHVGVRARRAR